jgi:hydrogenase nickel incorporation protein HypA/HybF
MHELSIANAILEAVQKEAAKRPGAHVAKVGVRVGALSGVVPDALSFGFECLVRGTELEPLVLVIETVPRRQRCPACEATFEVQDGEPGTAGFGSSLACPRCGNTETQLAGGDELDVAYLEIEEA